MSRPDHATQPTVPLRPGHPLTITDFVDSNTFIAVVGFVSPLSLLWLFPGALEALETTVQHLGQAGWEAAWEGLEACVQVSLMVLLVLSFACLVYYMKPDPTPEESIVGAVEPVQVHRDWELTERVLAKLDGQRSRNVFIAARGFVFHVPHSAHRLQPGGDLHFLAGKDITLGLTTATLKPPTHWPEKPGLSHLSRDEAHCLAAWLRHIAQKCELVGVLIDGFEPRASGDCAAGLQLALAAASREVGDGGACNLPWAEGMGHPSSGGDCSIHLQQITGVAVEQQRPAGGEAVQ